MLERLVEIYDQINVKLRLLILLVCCCLSGYLGYIDNIVPADVALSQAKKDAENIELEIAKINENFKQIVTLEEELKKAEEELVSLFTLLPPDVETDRLLGAMSILAAENGIMIRSFIPSAPSIVTSQSTPSGTPPDPSQGSGAAPNLAQGPVKSHPIKIKFDGAFSQAMIFMDKLMEMPRIIKIESITMSPSVAQMGMGSDPTPNPSTTEDKPTVLTVELDLVAYSQAASPTLSSLSIAPKTMGQQGATPPTPPNGGTPP